MIRCSSPQCLSRQDPTETPLFNVTLMVDVDLNLTEDLRKIPLEFYACVHCGENPEKDPTEDR